MKFIKNIKEFISYFNTPFVRPKIKLYIGKVSIGTPYFLPRKAIKDPDKPGYLKFVPKKIGFDVVTLGWKTKWSQFRFEWDPLISFVFFKWQIAITISATEQDHYWESWLYYQYETDKTKSKLERAIQCQKKYPQNWKLSKNGVETKVDYYDLILKKKYRLKKIEELREEKLNSLFK
jgi:hypothetical protein